MPLDSRKTAHIQALYNINSPHSLWSGRTKVVTFVYESAGVYSYTAISVIWRPQTIIDPQIPNVAGVTPLEPAAIYMLAPLATVFTGVVLVADTSTATQGGVAAANKYEIIEALPVGVVPGGTHYRCLLRRLR